MSKIIFGTTKWKPIRRNLGFCWQLDFAARVKSQLIVQTDGSLKCFKHGFKKNVEALGLVAWKQDICSKCEGTKFFSCWSHVKGGVCFKCGGVGRIAKMLVADEIFKNKPEESTHPLFGK